MSIINPISLRNSSHLDSTNPPGQRDFPRLRADGQRLQQALETVQSRIAPVWPLKDYVAVNPYLGFSDHTFLDARQVLQSVSDCEMLMSVDYYRDQYRRGKIIKSDLDTAIDELVSDGIPHAEDIDVNQLIGLLTEPPQVTSSNGSASADSAPASRTIRLISQWLDRSNGSDWSRIIRDELSKHCSAHYDEGQSIWPSPWKHLPLYQAWRCAMQHDRSFEVHGVKGFRAFVDLLPHQPRAAVQWLLAKLEVPEQLWEDVLHCVAMSTIGWSAWTNYQHRQASHRAEENDDFFGLLAMRLAYEVALSEQYAFDVNWNSMLPGRHGSAVDEMGHHDLLRYALLKANEVAYRRTLLADLIGPGGASSATEQIGDHSSQVQETQQNLAQMVFCIDVRSERLRRHLEASCEGIETFGFAGFFGLPIGFVPLGKSDCVDQVPALLTPQFNVYEGVEGAGDADSSQASQKRSMTRGLRRAWKEFQSSAVSSFGFVETTGVLYGLKLIARSLGLSQDTRGRFDGVPRKQREHLGPCLHGLEEQGITIEKQAEMAESILRGIGVTEDFARLVVFCGHGSQTENNPLQSGLDCGACGGHSGEANARFAAKLLNQNAVREALRERGICIGDEVWFVGALHNTTTDEVTFFDTAVIPESHREDLEQLKRHTLLGSQATRTERLAMLPGGSAEDLIRRSRDWSEVRPEWGLAGNAAFIAAPRRLTEKFSLDGRSFLHSYDWRRDTGFKVLEQIMTAPMVVANWINLQYYASTVDPEHFGSGSKTIHNVVGRFGILSGNSGDLMTGLPWQSVHDGQDYQHHPLRLLVILAAPREAISQIIAKHAMVKDLLTNGWLQLVAVEDGCFYRFTERQVWDRLQVVTGHAPESESDASLVMTS